MDGGINFNYGLGGNATDNFNDAYKTAKNGYVSSVVDKSLAGGDLEGARRQAIANGLYEKYAPVLKNMNDEQLGQIKRHNDAVGSAAIALTRIPKEQRGAFFTNTLRPGLLAAGSTDDELNGIDLNNDQILQGLVMRSLGAKDALDRFDYSKDGIADKLTGQYTQFATPGTDHVSVGPNGEQILTSTPGRARTTYGADGTILSGGQPEATAGYTNTGPMASGGGSVGAAPGPVGRAGSDRVMNYQARAAGFGSVPANVNTLGAASDFARQVNRAGVASSAMGTYQIVGQTLRGYAPRVFGANWRDVPFNAQNQDLVAKAIFEDNRGSAQALKSQWVSLSTAEAERIRHLPWEAARGVIARGESGGSVRVDGRNMVPEPTSGGPQPGNVTTTPNGTRITTLSGATRMTEAQRLAYQQDREDARYARQDSRDDLRYARQDARDAAKEAQGNVRAESGLRKDFNNLPEVKSFRVQQNSMKTMYALAKTPNAANDIALIFSYMKVLDPNSTVREGEFATAQNAGGIDTRVWNAYNKLKNGERLSPQQRSQFLGAARQSYNAAEGQYNDRATQYQSYAKDQGVNPLNVAPRMVPRKPAGGVSNTPKVGEVRRGYQFMGGNPASPNSWKKVN